MSYNHSRPKRKSRRRRTRRFRLGRTLSIVGLLVIVVGLGATVFWRQSAFAVIGLSEHFDSKVATAKEEYAIEKQFKEQQRRKEQQAAEERQRQEEQRQQAEEKQRLVEKEATIDMNERMIGELTTVERNNHELLGLMWDEQLQQIARQHSRDMAQHNYYDHDNLVGDGPTERGLKAGYSCRNGIYVGLAENIYLSTAVSLQPRGAVESWMNSPGHRDNMLGPTYNRIGVGIAEGAGGIYYTMLLC